MRNQVHDGKDGDDVLTPLVLADGSAVIVDRGWVAATGDQQAPTDTVAATGAVVVRGIAHTSSPLSAQDAVSHVSGQLALPRVDLARIAREVAYRLQPRWIEAQAQTPPPAAGSPVLPQPPAPDQVNHMEYAIEWFSFAAIGIIGWPIALMGFARGAAEGFSTPDRRDEGDDRQHAARGAGDAA